MARIWLVVDVSNLAWRAFHTFKGMNFGGYGTGIVYGLFRDIRSLMDLHATSRIAFCFDHGSSRRKTISENYKLARHSKELTEEELEAYNDLKRQVNDMRTKHLKRLGFQNIFYQAGYEGDDMIASVVHNLPKEDEAVVVSTDKDLYQLLSKRVCIWHPIKKECITSELFTEQWGISPRRWADVKALAGCPSDGVVGIKGIGEKFAAAYIRGEHKKGSRISKMVHANKEVYQFNRQLVKLPLEGTKVLKCVEDDVKPKAWKNLAEELGMKSIAGRVPGLVNGFGLKPRKVKE